MINEHMIYSVEKETGLCVIQSTLPQLPFEFRAKTADEALDMAEGYVRSVLLDALEAIDSLSTMKPAPEVVK